MVHPSVTTSRLLPTPSVTRSRLLGTPKCNNQLAASYTRCTCSRRFVPTENAYASPKMFDKIVNSVPLVEKEILTLRVFGSSPTLGAIFSHSLLSKV